MFKTEIRMFIFSCATKKQNVTPMLFLCIQGSLHKFIAWNQF